MTDLDPRIPQAAVALVTVAVTALLLFRRKKNGPPTVTELNVYPIKSCAEIRLSSAKSTPRGFENDRIAQVTDKNGVYCTPRDRGKEKLFHVKSELVFQEGTTKLQLTAPGADGGPFELDLAAKGKEVTAEAMDTPGVKLRDYGDNVAGWLQKATGIEGCRLTGIGGDEYGRTVKVNPDQGEEVSEKDAPLSLADEAPFLLTSLSSLDDLNRRLKERGKAKVDMRRFRPNIVVNGLLPWEEDSLKRIKIGGVEFHVWQRCGRCAMTTIDRDGLGRGPEPLATLSTFRERKGGMRNFGMHMIPVAGQQEEGPEVKMGDELVVLEYDEERRAEWKKLFS